MKYKKTVICIAFLLLGLGGMYAQENTVTTGSKATGIGGTASYSVGQIVYTSASGTNGSVIQGLQQPYEISVITGVDETTINLEMNIYPNPTTNFLTLKTEEFKNLEFRLIDLEGKVIKNKKIVASTTTIVTEDLSQATYFLVLINDNRVIKTFKVIKN